MTQQPPAQIGRGNERGDPARTAPSPPPIVGRDRVGLALPRKSCAGQGQQGGEVRWVERQPPAASPTDRRPYGLRVLVVHRVEGSFGRRVTCSAKRLQRRSVSPLRVSGGIPPQRKSRESRLAFIVPLYRGFTPGGNAFSSPDRMLQPPGRAVRAAILPAATAPGCCLSRPRSPTMTDPIPPSGQELAQRVPRR